jgi:hypothetical protein
MQKKIARGAQETIARFNQEMESSSENAISLKQRNFQIPPIFAPPKDVST